jgi:hypothetical protein
VFRLAFATFLHESKALNESNAPWIVGSNFHSTAGALQLTEDIRPDKPEETRCSPSRFCCNRQINILSRVVAESHHRYRLSVLDAPQKLRAFRKFFVQLRLQPRPQAFSVNDHNPMQRRRILRPSCLNFSHSIWLLNSALCRGVNSGIFSIRRNVSTGFRKNSWRMYSVIASLAASQRPQFLDAGKAR